MHFAARTPLFVLLLTIAAITSSSASDGKIMSDAEREGEGGKFAVKNAEAVLEDEIQEKPQKRTPRFSGNMGKRQKWEDCVGIPGIEARQIIRQARPDLKKIVLVKDGSMVTMDMRMDRVRIWVDENGIVIRPPRVG